MSQDSGEAPKNVIASPPKRTGIWFTSFIVIAVGVLLVALLLPTVRTARPAAYRAQCANNLKQIALALLQYEQTYNSLPPAYTVDADGKRLHSWRTLVLPFIEGKSVYQKIDLSKAWDDPANSEAYNTSVWSFRCPRDNCPQNHTTYLASVSPNGCFRPTGPRPLSEVSDALSQTLMVIEVPDDRSVHWMSPLDADETLIMAWGSNSKLAHNGGVNAAFCDGSVHFLKDNLSPAARRALISGSGNYESAR